MGAKSTVLNALIVHQLQNLLAPQGQGNAAPDGIVRIGEARQRLVIVQGHQTLPLQKQEDPGGLLSPAGLDGPVLPRQPDQRLKGDFSQGGKKVQLRLCQLQGFAAAGAAAAASVTGLHIVGFLSFWC